MLINELKKGVAYMQIKNKFFDSVKKVVENEIYNESGANNGRAYTNVQAIYENIKLDFYHRINN